MITYHFTATKETFNQIKFDQFIIIYDEYLEKKNQKSALTDGTKRQSRIMRNRFYKFLTYNDLQNIRINDLSEKILNQFFTELKNGSRPTSSYHRNIFYELISVFDYAIAKGYCRLNPISLIDVHIPEPNKLFFLETQHMNYLQFVKVNPYMRAVLDLFIVQCYTGFSYSDLIKFNAPDHLTKDSNGKYKIILPRTKTKQVCIIPVLNRVMNILKKYDFVLPTKR
jgi:integrase/recombinase XerD